MTNNSLRSALRRLSFTPDGMVPPEVSSATRLQIERQMLDLLVKGMRQMLLTSALIGPLLLLWLTLPHIGAVKAVTLTIILLVLATERALLLPRIMRERALNDDNPSRWGKALAWRSALGGTTHAVWFHFTAELGTARLESQMIALLTILSAGAAALFSSWPPVMWAVITPMLLGMALQLALMDDAGHFVQASFCAVLWIVLASASLRSTRTLINEALIRLRNEELMSELHEKHAQAEAANAAKSRFFAAASHDLRQPLQAMSLYLSVLPAPAHMEDHEADALARMRQCMTALDQMLESLLDVSRFDSGQFTPVQRVFPLQPLLEHLAGMYQSVAHQKGLQLRVHPTGAWVNSDPALLERALSNLLANSLRYTWSGGVLLAARRRGEHLRVCVVDTGMGIPTGDQEVIFEEFVQLGNPERNPEQGYGLGLATVSRIAALLKHPIHLQSRVGRGSIFMLDVPAAEPSKDAAPDLLVDAPPRLRGRVLVVEDHALVRDALVRQLTEWGLQVETASHGEAAFATIAKAEFDAVLSDWRLPGSVDGLAVLNEATARLPNLKLGLLITGEDTQLLRQLSPEFPVLRKPVRPLRLRTLLARHLQAA